MTTCGVGGWGGPLPGDPSNDVVLSAVPAYGGIDVKWSYPAVNPYAVAYVKVFRGYNNNSFTAVQVAEVGGDRYFDALPTVTTCFYWIQLVSSNGTTLALVGPESATSRLMITEIIEQLSGQIDASLLAAALRTPIERIPLIELNLADEITARLADNASLQLVLDAVDTDIGDVATLVASETAVRISSNSAIVTQLDALAVGVSGNAAAIITESTVRADEVSALAERVDILYAGGVVGNAELAAAVEVERLARIAADGALASTLTTLIATERTATDAADVVLTAAISDANTARTTGDTAIALSVTNLQTTLNTKIGVDIGAAISTEQSARVSADTALGVRIDTTQASIVTAQSTVTALVSDETTARVTADGTLASSITTAQTTLNESIASARTDLTADIAVVDGKATAIGARYTAVVDVSGLVGGFGIYNTGTTVDAGFNVDTFWVGKASDKIKPFIITGGVVYINEAVIPTLTANKIDTRGMLIRNAAGQVIFGAGAEVDPSVYMSVPSTWLNSNAVATAAADATAKANAAVSTAAAAAQAKADLAEVTAKAYAGGIVSAEEARAIADATAKANAAQAAAIAAAAADATAKANAAQTAAATDATTKANAAQTAAIASATTALAGKLNSGTASTLSAVLSLNASASSGLRVGNLTWDTAGARISGYGLGITPAGIAGFNPAGVSTFSFNAGTGDLSLKGDISGSTGNFVGSVSVNGATWANGVTGFFAGMASGYARLRVGSADQYLSYDQLTGKLSLKLDGFSVALSTYSIGYSQLGYPFTYNPAAITSTVTGGLGTKSYKWSLDVWAVNGLATMAMTSSPTSSSFSFEAVISGPAGSISATVTCQVTDANGRVTSNQTNVSIAESS